MENLDFLKTKYNIHTSPEVEKSAERTEKRTGEKIPPKPEARIQNYLDRFKEIIERENPEKREYGLNALKRLLHSKFVIKPDQIPQGYYNLQGEIARELGREQELIDSGAEIKKTTELDDKGNEAEKRIYIFPEEIKEQLNTNAINNQQKSLDKWVDYLASPDAQYPDWAKYWTLRSVLEMGKLQKELDEKGRETANFQKREKNTVASFPMLNPRALALTIGALRSRLEEKAKPKKERKPIGNKSVKLNEQEFQQLLSTEKFSKIYAQFLIEMPEYSTEGLQETRGKWIKYLKGSEADGLVKSLEGYPLEWCTADYDTAQTQLQGGDFYVYYSINEAGEAIIPRLAIRLEDKRIAEARGIASDQNLDPYIVPVLEEKLKEFGAEGEAYKKKSADMKLLTAVEDKVKKRQELSKDDLIFLYEINTPVEGFGYEKDPRIEEIRQTRNSEEDAPVVFECAPEQIAWQPEDVDDNTKAYVGPLFKGIFQKNIKHIYTTFPEGRIKEYDIEIGGKTKNQLIKELQEKNLIRSDVNKMIERQNFTISKNTENIKLVKINVCTDFFGYNVTLKKIYQKAKELGLEICPEEVAINLILQYPELKKIDLEEVHIGMEPIDVGGDNFGILFLSSPLYEAPMQVSYYDFYSILSKNITNEYKFIFRLRKSEA